MKFVPEHVLFTLQLQITSGILKEKLKHEELYTSRITSTETALEQTKMLLSNLQLETSSLVKNLEKSRRTEEQDHHRDLMTLADRVSLETTFYVQMVKESICI